MFSPQFAQVPLLGIINCSLGRPNLNMHNVMWQPAAAFHSLLQGDAAESSNGTRLIHSMENLDYLGPTNEYL